MDDPLWDELLSLLSDQTPNPTEDNDVEFLLPASDGGSWGELASVWDDLFQVPGIGEPADSLSSDPMPNPTVGNLSPDLLNDRFGRQVSKN